MTQTVVNFLTKVNNSLVIDPRIFDFEIPARAQDNYIYLMSTLKGMVQAPGNTTTAIQQLLTDLNNWSQLIVVENGQNLQTYAGYNIDTHTFLTAPQLAALDLSQNPRVVTTTMNRYMAEYVDRIIRTFRSAGWDPIADSASDPGAYAALSAIRANPTIYQIETYINQAIGAANSAILIGDSSTQSQSLQQLLMVDYISRGNELLFGEMKQLQTAIDLNQNTLSYLNSLQDLMNQKDPQQFLMKLQLLSTTSPSSLSLDKYTDFENQSFNQTLGTVAKFTTTQLRSYLDTLTSLNLSSDVISNLTPEQYESLIGTATGSFLTLSQLQDMTTTFNSSSGGINTILTNLDFLINQLTASAGGSATRLIQSLQAIRADIASTQNSGGIVTWIQDFGVNREGDYQRRLNDAIVASQSLNDTKREELRRVMFVFEEFYKSATSMLSRITQLLERMASSISR